MTDLILRPATMADVPALTALAVASFVDAFGHLYSKADLAAFLSVAKSEAATAARSEEHTSELQSL